MRTRRDRTEQRNKGFASQWPAMVDAYMAWSAEQGETGVAGTPKERGTESDGAVKIRVVDMLSES